MGKLFGTDGIRGITNQEPITPEMGIRLGRAIMIFCKQRELAPKIVIGRDTRASGEMLEHAIISGILSQGGSVCQAGIFPTPGVSFLTKEFDAGAGIVISASHNPHEYNGFKVFSNKGIKLSEADELEIETNMLSEDKKPRDFVKPFELTRVTPWDDAENRYISFLLNSLSENLLFKDLKIILDCANGATYRVAPAVFKQLGANVETVFTAPDGININHNCGSQHTDFLSERVIASSADIGLAFDGDGDRMVAVDEKGVTLTGDQILIICAHMLKKQGKLTNRTVVSTVMSNIGFQIALEDMDIRHVAADVGDRNVLEEMIKNNAVLGGEDSGHIIFKNHHTTGDGILSALQLILAMQEAKQPLSNLAGLMTVFPQVLMNVPVIEKPDISSLAELASIIRKVEQGLAGKGRVLVRYSGTEPLCRVMVEGAEEAEVARHAKEIARVVEKTIGA